MIESTHNTAHQPFLDFAAVISEGDGHSVDVVGVKRRDIWVKIRGHPTHPHIEWLLAWKDPH